MDLVTLDVLYIISKAQVYVGLILIVNHINHEGVVVVAILIKSNILRRLSLSKVSERGLDDTLWKFNN